MRVEQPCLAALLLMLCHQPLLSQESPRLVRGLERPIDGEKVQLSNTFGMRKHPILRQNRMHTGVDWAAPRGHPVVAAAGGLVISAKRRGSFGNQIILRHESGFETTYSHLNIIRAEVRPGARVKRGQVIGEVGSTGLAATSHLHFEVLVNGRPVNPLAK